MTPQAAFCSVPAGKGAELKTYIPVVPHKAVAEVSKIGNL
jgi:hypothetical protein